MRNFYFLNFGLFHGKSGWSMMQLGVEKVPHLQIHWGEIQSFAGRHDKAIALRQGIER